MARALHTPRQALHTSASATNSPHLLNVHSAASTFPGISGFHSTLLALGQGFQTAPGRKFSNSREDLAESQVKLMISRIGFDRPVGCPGFCLLPELLISFPALLLCWKFKGSLEGGKNPSKIFPLFGVQVTVLHLFAKSIAFLVSSSTQHSVNEH